VTFVDGCQKQRAAPEAARGARSSARRQKQRAAPEAARGARSSARLPLLRLPCGVLSCLCGVLSCPHVLSASALLLGVSRYTSLSACLCACLSVCRSRSPPLALALSRSSRYPGSLFAASPISAAALYVACLAAAAGLLAHRRRTDLTSRRRRQVRDAMALAAALDRADPTRLGLEEPPAQGTARAAP
jgi:hypothetical protein